MTKSMVVLRVLGTVSEVKTWCWVWLFDGGGTHWDWDEVVGICLLLMMELKVGQESLSRRRRKACQDQEARLGGQGKLLKSSIRARSRAAARQLYM